MTLILALCIVFTVAVSQCHLLTVNQTKSGDVVTTTENGSVKNVTEVKDMKKLSGKVKTEGNNRVYLEDVLFRLKNQNWSQAEEPCLNQTLLWLKSLQNYTLWAVWGWDSISSEATGLLTGSTYQLGNFDECVGAPWRETHPELLTQYCLARIRLERTDVTVKRKPNVPFDPYQSALDFIGDHPQETRPLDELIWGVCVPASCQPQSVKRLISIMLSKSHLGTTGIIPHIQMNGVCQKAGESKPYDRAFYAFVIFASVLVGVVVICTYVTCNDLIRTNAVKNIIKACSLKENALDLLKVKKEGIEVLYGVRWLTVCLIVLDHQFGIMSSGALSNGRNVDKLASSLTGALVVHNDLFVDTYFMMSGFLVATTLMKFKRLPNPVILIVKRYVRLVVAFAVMVFFLAAVYPYIGDGPLWPQNSRVERDTCRKNWWLSLLMLSNYVNSDEICYVVSWYIPCDFHFFIITVLLFWLYKKLPRLGLACAGFVAVLSIVVPGVINYVYDLPAVQLFTYDFVKDPRAHPQWEVTYIRSHVRFGAYLVGVACGFIFAAYRRTGNLDRLSKKWSTLGSLFGIFIMLAVMMCGHIFLHGGYSTLEKTLYAATNRPVWAAGLGLMVLCCVFGKVPLLKTMLSWYPWVPLSRLTYGIYLTHTIFINRQVSVVRNPLNYDVYNIEVDDFYKDVTIKRSRLTTDKKDRENAERSITKEIKEVDDFYKDVTIKRSRLTTDKKDRENAERSITKEIKFSMAAGVVVWSTVSSLMIWLFAEAPANNLLVLLLKRGIGPVVEQANGNDHAVQSTSANITTEEKSQLESNLPTTVHIISSKI